MKKLLALLLAAMMVFTVAGCEKAADKAAEVVDKVTDELTDETPATSDDTVAPEATEEAEETAVATDVVGTYLLTAMEMDGEIQTENLPIGGLTLNADGTGTYGPTESPWDINWTQDGETVTLTAATQSTPLVMTFDGIQLVAEEAGAKMIFTKQ